MSPWVVRNGKSASRQCLGCVVSLAVKISLLFVRTLPATAIAAPVTQCMPAPVSPNHMALALEGA
eukprot:4163020-Pleurochrysis_carterae.AAC.1